MAMIGIHMRTIVPVIENVRHQAADQAFSYVSRRGVEVACLYSQGLYSTTPEWDGVSFSALALTSSSLNFLSC
jgi:hypothetical protein